MPMKTLQKNTQQTLDAVISFMIWTSVFALGILISTTLFRILVASGVKVYQLVHS